MTGSGTTSTRELVTVREVEEREVEARKARYTEAVVKALGWEKLSVEMRELAIAISARYDLDPMLRHVVMVEGKPFITRDALLHVAHKSGDFDGIEVTQPRVEGQWIRAQATVYRKSFSRPFSYPGRYPVQGGNTRYNEEMAIKNAEAMTLRRAFDVSAPTLEEQWEEAFESGQGAPAPASLADRIEARAASLGEGTADPATVAPPSAERSQPVGPDVAAREDPEPLPAAGTIVETTITPDAVAVEEPDALADLVEQAEADGGEGHPEEPEAGAAPGGSLTVEEFKEAVKDVDRDLLRVTAARLFPDLSNFRDLDGSQLHRLLDEVITVTTQAEEAAEAERDAALAERADAEEGQFVAPAAGFTVDPESPKAPAPSSPDPSPLRGAAVELCGVPSPYNDGKTCSMDKGHGGPHRAGTRLSW